MSTLRNRICKINYEEPLNIENEGENYYRVQGKASLQIKANKEKIFKQSFHIQKSEKNNI